MNVCKLGSLLMAKLAVRRLQRDGDGAGVDSIDVSAAGRDLDPPAGFSVPSMTSAPVSACTPVIPA